MNWEMEHQRLADHHGQDLQSATLARHALESARMAIGELAKLGHRYDLTTDVKADPPVEWPKMYYHDDGRAQVVTDDTAAGRLGPGWRDTLARPHDSSQED